MDIIQVERISMTAQEKRIIENILIDVGLEPLWTGANNQEPKTKPSYYRRGKVAMVRRVNSLQIKKGLLLLRTII